MCQDYLRSKFKFQMADIALGIVEGFNLKHENIHDSVNVAIVIYYTKQRKYQDSYDLMSTTTSRTKETGTTSIVTAVCQVCHLHLQEGMQTE